MNKEALEKLKLRMINHAVINDETVVMLSAAELQDLITAAEHQIKKNSEPIENNKHSSWMFNVVDEFKPLTKDEIVSKIKEQSLPFAIMMAQIERDFNYGSVIRSANFLGAESIYHYGKRRFDRRSCVGTYLYSNIVYLKSHEEIVKLKEKYIFVALENNLDFKPQNLHSFTWPKEPVLIVIGEEGCGISKDILALCDHFVEIPGRGSVRSMNAAVAATSAMYDLITKNYT